MKNLKQKEQELKKECDKTLLSEIKNLELQVKKQELKNKLASLSPTMRFIAIEMPEIKGNKPSFFGRMKQYL